MECYEDILSRMREKYREESGLEPEDVSDTGLRLRVLAGELFRMQAEIGWLKRQAFPQTACGEQLDLHGIQRGVLRREASRAEGVITFARYLPLSFDLVIPKGTVCAASGEDAVEYETVRDAVLTAGELSADAPARALLGGPGGNAAAGYVNTLVTPPNGIQYAVNRTPFTGGADREGDEEYRARVLLAYSRTANSGNAAYYEEEALREEGVASAQAVPRENGAGTVSVYVRGKDGPPSEALMKKLEDRLNGLREVGVTVSVKAAVEKAVNVTARVRLKPGTDFQRAKADTEEALRLWFLDRRVGDPVYLSELSRVILNAAPVEKLEFPITMRDIAPAAGTVPTAGTLAVEETT